MSAAGRHDWARQRERGSAWLVRVMVAISFGMGWHAGRVLLLPPEKASRTLKAGEFTRARIVGTQGHDLVGVPV